MENKRAAVYVRVSTAEQRDEGQSVDSQIDALKSYCDDNGMTIAGIYNDAGISARKKYTKRPALLQLMEDCKNKKVDIILFTKLDRWFRSVADYYEVQSVLEAAGVPWRAIWEDYETETSAGVFKVNIMLSIAQAEADRTSERIKAVNEYRKATGQYTSGKAPIGYISKDSSMIKDEEKREAVEAFFAEYELTHDILRSLDELHARGVCITRQTATRMLRNPAYMGETASGYRCEPYITKEQYHRNVDTIEQRTRKPIVTNRCYMFSGLIKCAVCGGVMSGKTRYGHTKKGTHEYKYYLCSRFSNKACRNCHTITEKAVERQAREMIRPALDEYIITSKSVPAVEDNTVKIKALEAKLERIGQRFEDGDITREEYRAKRDSIKSEIASLDVRYEAELKRLPDNWEQIYHELSTESRKSFWRSILKRIEVDENRNIQLFF